MPNTTPNPINGTWALPDWYEPGGHLNTTPTSPPEYYAQPLKKIATSKYQSINPFEDYLMDHVKSNSDIGEYMATKTVTDPAATADPLPGFGSFLFGCDPEFFLCEKKNGTFVPAHHFLKGTKEEPFKVPGGAIQVDGLAGEVNIDPVDNYKDFTKNLNMVMDYVRSLLPPDIEISKVATAKFLPEIYNEVPEAYLELGCSPDFNAWTGTMNPPPSVKGIEYMRCAGGHLHFGWTQDRATDDLQHILHCRDLVQQLDWMLGLWSTRIDSDTDRRRLYGKAGACRIKNYGVEYRVLSNFWLHDPKQFHTVWNRMQIALNHMSGHFFPIAYPAKYNSWVQSIIDDPSTDGGIIYKISTDLQVPFLTTKGLF